MVIYNVNVRLDLEQPRLWEKNCSYTCLCVSKWLYNAYLMVTVKRNGDLSTIVGVSVLHPFQCCIFTVLQQCSKRWLRFVFQSAGQWPGTQWKRTFWLVSVVIAKPLGTRPAVLCFFTNRTDATGMATWEARESGRKKKEKVPCFKVHLRLRILAHNILPLKNGNWTSYI